MQKVSVNLGVLGDYDRKSLLLRFRKDHFPYYPHYDDAYGTSIVIDSVEKSLGLWDIPMMEEYDRLRPIWYPYKDVLIICFSVDSPDSLEIISQKYIPELKHYCSKVPIILVANKMDLRNDPTVINDLGKRNLRPVTREEGYAVAQKIEASAYLECSAKTKEGVHEVFEVATRAGLQFKKTKRKNKCCLL